MNTINIRGDEWEVDYLLAMLSTMKPGKFQKQGWTPRDALVSNDGRLYTIYTGQTFDPDKMTLCKGFWGHDHCEACNWELNDFQGEEHAVGYFNGYNWLCEECYRLFVLEDRLNLKLGQQVPNQSAHTPA